MPYTIRSPQDRERLEVRDKPYFEPVSDDVHIGYRKGKIKRSWIIRWKIASGYRTETVIGAAPDDVGASPLSSPISFQQMEKRIMADAEYNCSFCGKSSKVVEKLVAGPGVYICNRCHEIAGYYMDHPDAKTPLKLDEDGRTVLNEKGEPVFEDAE